MRELDADVIVNVVATFLAVFVGERPNAPTTEIVRSVSTYPLPSLKQMTAFAWVADSVKARLAALVLPEIVPCEPPPSSVPVVQSASPACMILMLSAPETMPAAASVK